ncbi:MAG: L,D-transpeptidase [Verrucomicrobiales bacterium]
MEIRTLRSLVLAAVSAVVVSALTSCAVDQNAALTTDGGGVKTKKSTVKTESEQPTWAERREAARQEREERRAEAAREKAKELAEKKAAEERKAKELAEKKKAEEAAARKLEAREKAVAAREAIEEAKRREAEERAREAELAAKREEKERRRAAKLAAKKKAAEEREARRLAEKDERDSSRGGGGFFSLFGGGVPAEYQSEGHDVYVDRRLVDALNPANAKIEIDISDQKVRVYKGGGPAEQLVIETKASTGRSGYSTPTGTFRIKEKLVEKRSSLYGRWVNASGATVQVDGDSRYRPPGGVRFIGAEMPYWMRLTGGIGMHIGYVPDQPASHGCIRVPEAVQPLIFSKVGLGTPVTIKY